MSIKSIHRLFIVCIFLLAASLPGKAQDPCMDHSWANSFDALNSTIDADAAGNVYVTGSFSDSIILGKDTLYGPAVSYTRRHSFVARISPEGQYLWAVAIPGTGDVHSCAVKVGNTGEIYIAGCFTQTAFFGPDTLTSVRTHYHDLFLSTLSADGEFISTVTNNIYATSGYSIEQHISSGITPLAIDGAGNLYLSGGFGGTIELDGITLTSATSNPDELVFAKLNRSGRWDWAIAPQGGGTYHGIGHTITTDATGNAYVFGKTRANRVFGNDTLAMPPDGTDPFYLAKISTDGQWQWAKVAGRGKVNADAAATAIAISPTTGNIFLSGAFFPSLPAIVGDDTLTFGAFIAGTDPQGQVLWVHEPWGGAAQALAPTPGKGCFASSYRTIYHISETGVLTDSVQMDQNASIASWGNFQHPLLAADAGGRLYATGRLSGAAAFGDITVEAPANGVGTYVTEISCDPPAGVHDRREHPARYTVFPNPTTGMLMIDLGYPADAVMEIYDLHGRRLAVHEITGQQFAAMKLDGPPGIYLLQVTTEAGRIAKKIIKQ